MPGIFERAENAVLRTLHRRPLSGVAEHGAFWSSTALLTVSLLRLLPGTNGAVSDLTLAIIIPIWIVFALIILYRWLVGHVLWKVRNRLVVTYLLMGLAPVVLFATLIGVAAYIFAGQFATFAATSELNSALGRLGAENQAFAVHVAHAIARAPSADTVELADYESTDHGILGHMSVSAWVSTDASEQRPLHLVRDGATLTPPTGSDAVTFPAWAEDGFHGTVLDHGHLFLRAVNRRSVAGHQVTFVSSAPLTQQTLTVLAQGLGLIHIIPDAMALREGDARSGEHVRTVTSEELSAEASGAVSGGEVPPQAFFLDRRITFPTPLATRQWSNGDAVQSLLTVTSRPSLLYSHLFGSGINIGSAIVRFLLIPLTVLFAVIELMAFIMAVRLNRTITNAIADLYRATTAIDSGNFAHRIRVLRRDQLAALSTSFNTMSESLERLLEQQREKERMQSELEIAQEVQDNLFPHGEVDMPGLELYGVCRPARTVSGDYYDFLLLGESELTLAMGDISGKGISAALLMASLHSAVRAYRFAGEDCPEDQIISSNNPSFSSPGKVLRLLNRQLYRSTQPEKYATLFLAHYNTATRTLIYANGGQLPPFVLCANGAVRRLDRGGSVVGLLDNLSYEEGTVKLDAGDILVAYSDGVTEPENEFGEFGETRLIEMIQRHRHLPLAAIAQQVLLALRAWIGEQEQPDDITVVLVRQTETAGSALNQPS